MPKVYISPMVYGLRKTCIISTKSVMNEILSPWIVNKNVSRMSVYRHLSEDLNKLGWFVRA